MIPFFYESSLNKFEGENVPGLQAHRQGWEVMLDFNDHVGQALKNLYDQDFDGEAMILLKATKIIR